MCCKQHNNLHADIYLASASPRRAQLLEQIGVRYNKIQIDVDEVAISGESPKQQVERLAILKAHAGWNNINGQALLPVLAADTMVVIDNQVLGKPASKEHAINMLQQLSGKQHDVLSGVAVVNKQHTESIVVHTQVKFRTLSIIECQDYWNTGEPKDKAGAYGIQGYGAILVESITGSYSNIVGLPLLETSQMLKRFGISVWHEI